jgi:hypothetical protein
MKMGTRGIMHILDEQFCILCTIYHQYDGYPSGLGAWIKKLLNAGKAEIINGISGQKHPEHFNGMGDLAAYLIKNMKDGIGGVYLYPPGWAGSMVEYEYKIWRINDYIAIDINSVGGLFSAFGSIYKQEQLYRGLLKDFDPDDENYGMKVIKNQKKE